MFSLKNVYRGCLFLQLTDTCKQDSGRNGRIKGINVSKHRDFHDEIGIAKNEIGNTEALASNKGGTL